MEAWATSPPELPQPRDLAGAISPGKLGLGSPGSRLRAGASRLDWQCYKTGAANEAATNIRAATTASARNRVHRLPLPSEFVANFLLSFASSISATRCADERNEASTSSAAAAAAARRRRHLWFACPGKLLESTTRGRLGATPWPRRARSEAGHGLGSSRCAEKDRDRGRPLGALPAVNWRPELALHASRFTLHASSLRQPLRPPRAAEQALFSRRTRRLTSARLCSRSENLRSSTYRISPSCTTRSSPWARACTTP